MESIQQPARPGHIALDRTEVWTKVNADGERIYIAVQFEGGRLVAASNARATAESAREGMLLYGVQARWVEQNRDGFEVVR